MATCIVLWTSDSRATIVAIGDGVERVVHIGSKAGRPVAKGRRHRRVEHYRKVIEAIRDAQSVFIFGPAQAKTELKGEMLRTEGLGHRVVGTELAESMTDSEVVARAREICGLGGR